MRRGALTEPLLFEPIFMERIWGGRRLASLYGKRLPAGAQIGESWEIVDRPEAQSVVASGSWRGRTLHDLWINERQSAFGDIEDAPRFPLLIKLLDASEKLSLQVHPPPEIAAEHGGEAKTEFWYIADAAPEAELYVGIRSDSSREEFEQAIAAGNVQEHVQRLAVKTGDAMFLPSGRVHAIGAGNLIVEIQQNSDTTYRVFDWNRKDANGDARTLHVDESLRAIDFADCDPQLIRCEGESLVRHRLFEIDKWKLDAPRAATSDEQFAIVCCLTGAVRCARATINGGGFFLVPPSLADKLLHPADTGTTLLRVSVPRP